VKPLLRSRAEQGALLVAALLLAGSGWVPQFGGPGYESALAGGLVLPSCAAIGTALLVAGTRPQPFDALGRGVAFGGVVALVGALLATLHGLRVGFCDAPLGYELWATGPGPGAVVGGAWGAAAGLYAARWGQAGQRRRQRVVAVLAALAGPVGCIAIGFGRFYTSPMVFGFDPFVGYFAGPLYDTVVEPGARLISYRIGTVASLLAVAAVAWHLELDDAGRLRLARREPERRGVVIAGALAASLSLAITLSGPRLGHWHTRASIEEGLGRSLSAGRCTVVYSAAVPRADAARVGDECVGHLPEIEAYLGARGPERVTVFLFASDAEKGAYMGASHTYIAKPWRGEVYLQAAGFPHPTLGHELAHVVSGSFGAGPFHVAGPLGGLIPDPGRIEGIAVAASPGEDDDFTLQEWSKALLDLGLLPDMPSIFRLGFLAKSHNAAYTVAGAFVSWFHDRYGAAALRGWYSGQAIETVARGQSLSALDREFRAELARIQLRPELAAMAKARFDRPSIFGRVCPRRVDRELSVAEGRLGAGDTRGAREALQALLALEPQNTRARLGLALCAVREGALDDAIQRYQALATDPRLSVLERASALEARGDVQTMAERPADAMAAYRQVAALDADDDRRRTMEVKTLAAGYGPREGKALRALLIGDPQLGPSWDEAAPLLGAQAADGDPLAQYLVGRNLWLHGRAAAALGYLNAALEPAPTPPRGSAYSWPPPYSIVREASRLRIIIACSDKKLERARAAEDVKRLRDDPNMPAAKKDAAARFAKRCGL
jgi:tetratricopeptide (TPR) repeat protein